MEGKQGINEKKMNIHNRISAGNYGNVISFVYYLGTEMLFVLAITSGTFLYHFVMRLFVGWLVNVVSKKTYNADSFWFREKRFEQRLYKLLRVKQWKSRIPSYAPDSFSLKKHTVDEIIQNMCIAELVHEFIIVLGYGSVLFCLFTESPRDNIAVFLITAVIAGGIDLIFVIMQRYNRPRVLGLKRHTRKNEKRR